MSCIERGGVEGAADFVELFCTFSGVLGEHAERGRSAVVGHKASGWVWKVARGVLGRVLCVCGRDDWGGESMATTGDRSKRWD